MRTSWIALVAAACATPQMPPPAKLSVPAPQAPAAVPGASARLEGIARRYWTALLEGPMLPLLGDGVLGGPLFATALGDHRFDAKLDDLSADAYRRLEEALAQLRTELVTLTPAGLSAEELLTLEMLRRQLSDAEGVATCEAELWVVDQLAGPHVALVQTATYYPLATAQGASELAVRYGQAGRFFDQLIANLRRGAFQNKTAPRMNVQRVIASLDDLLKGDAASSLLLPPASRFAGLPEAQRGPARERIRVALADQLLPGLRRYREFLAGELLPRARSDVGLWAMAGGEGCYAALVAHHTGAKRPSQELHQTGLDLLGSIEAEMEQIARAEGAGDAKAYRVRLEKQPEQAKKTAEELLEWNRATLARAMAALPRSFRRLPPRPIETRAIEAYRAASSTPAFYQPAPDDGAQPAFYYVNTLRPQTRLLYNQEALCFHETVPGHHLQIAIAQELRELPDFRRQTGETAFVEGWALYAERLSDEALHLYSGPAARFGMLGYQAWRAARLAVDTGMHALRWDRERALQFLRDHTTLSPEEAANEIDRYAIHPAQALAYMVGETELLKLRALAKQKLGSSFDLREFHEVVLSHGAVPLASLGRVVQEWIDARSAKSPR